MTEQFDNQTWRHITQCLVESKEIADHYRHTIGDEDSIVLQRNLKAIAQALGIPVSDTSPAHTEARSKKS